MTLAEYSAQSDGAWIDATEERSNLTRSQYLIWTAQSLHPGSPLYNIPFAIHFACELDVARFRSAFSDEVAHNDALQTYVETSNGVPSQRKVSGDGLQRLVHHAMQLPLIDLSAEENPRASAQDWLKRRIATSLPIDEPMWDGALLATGDKSFVWFLNQHHLITDAWSSMKILDRVIRAYVDAGYAPPEIRSFADYAAAERGQRGSERLQKLRAYWRDGISEPTDEPDFYGVRATHSSPDSDRIEVELGRAEAGALDRFAASTGMLSRDLGLFSVYAVLLASFVARTSNARRFAIGVPVHNRTDRASRDTPGLFIEMLPLLVDVRGDDTFRTLLERVQAGTLETLRHAAAGAASPEAIRICHVVLNFFTNPLTRDRAAPVRTEWLHPQASDAGHKLRLHAHDYDGDGRIRLYFEFNRGAFPGARRKLAIEHFSRILAAFASEPDRAISTVDLLTRAERETYVERFNATRQSFESRDVLGLFHEQVKTSPQRIAIAEDGRTLDYRELDARAAALAAVLVRRGAGAGDLVPIMAGRSAETIVAILAVLKSGAAYLPLNPREPELRLSAILEDALSSAFRTVGPVLLPAETSAPDCPIDCLGIALEKLDLTDTLPAAPRCDRDAAYVIYTSGSTGTPKGVVVEDRSLVNYLLWARGQYTKGPADFALHTTPAVDLTVTSIFLPLISGGRIRVFTEQGATGEIPIVDVFRADDVDAVKLTPAHLNLVREVPGRARRIRTLILGGEDLKSAIVRGVLDKFPPDTRIFNEYGPTEATVGCMTHEFNATRDQWTSVPIGRPIANTAIYLLNESGQPVPEGVIGEICIGGAGVARGYLTQTGEAARKFVPNPFEAAATLYRSGDLGRWSRGARLEFLGRRDEQTKIRGVRVEAAEVQAAIQRHPHVSDCIVILDELDARDEASYCELCGIPSNHPDVHFDSRGVCSLCVAFDRFRDQAQRYFKTPRDFAALAAEMKRGKHGDYDCLALFSGGKDSTYMLYKLVECGLNPLAFTLDNGHISEGAKANIARAVGDLGIDHEYGSTPHMPEIFADSLARYSNVCNGCFKTIYTLSVNLARQRDVCHIVTGLSRGQIFETRLHDLFRYRIFDSVTIEQRIIDARKIYHRMEDSVAKVLDVSIFADDAVFSDIRFVDFYRYWDVPLDDVYAFLGDRAPWVRPADTGRSTNCLINDVGIYVHKIERGFHNYALPYSWDVRLGHKTRDEALDELNDDIDVERVRGILREVGYSERQRADALAERQLVAYYVGDEVADEKMRAFLGSRLPTEMIPTRFVRIDDVPLAANGKVDRRKLPVVASDAMRTDYVAPRTDLERRLAGIWSQILGKDRVGVHDNFFEIGGHSLPAIQVISRVSEAYDIELPIRAFFNAPTIADVSAIVEKLLIEQIDQLSDAEVERQLTGTHHE